MPFSFGDTFSDVSYGFAKVPLVGTIINSALYTAILITVVITIIFMYVFSWRTPEDSNLTLALRGGFYSLVFISGIILTREAILSRAPTYMPDSMRAGMSGLTSVPVLPTAGMNQLQWQQQAQQAQLMQQQAQQQVMQQQQQAQQQTMQQQQAMPQQVMQQQAQPGQFTPGNVPVFPPFVQNPVPPLIN